MSLTITTCAHLITEIEGEKVCRQCGKVIGYSEVESINDWQSHGGGIFQNSNNYGLISKMAKNLHLPFYAVQTILKISFKISKMPITKKQSILFATVYACRIHNIPRLLGDIFYELEKASGKKIRRSEKVLLKLLNRIAKKIESSEIIIVPPNKEYYLQAYLAKIQDVIIRETDEQYFEKIRARSIRYIIKLRTDPSSAAKEAILCNACKILQLKIKMILK